MQETRPADYYIGCLDGCVFIDFNRTNNNCICLQRISFDGYGCCELDGFPMSKEDSKLFIDTYMEENLDQEVLTKLVIKTIKNNKQQIWQDALKEFHLMEDE
jgi:hypothetical protein